MSALAAFISFRPEVSPFCHYLSQYIYILEDQAAGMLIKKWLHL